MSSLAREEATGLLRSRSCHVCKTFRDDPGNHFGATGGTSQPACDSPSVGMNSVLPTTRRRGSPASGLIRSLFIRYHQNWNPGVHSLRSSEVNRSNTRCTRSMGRFYAIQIAMTRCSIRVPESTLRPQIHLQCRSSSTCKTHPVKSDIQDAPITRNWTAERNSSAQQSCELSRRSREVFGGDWQNMSVELAYESLTHGAQCVLLTTRRRGLTASGLFRGEKSSSTD